MVAVLTAVATLVMKAVTVDEQDEFDEDAGPVDKEGTLVPVPEHVVLLCTLIVPTPLFEALARAIS